MNRRCASQFYRFLITTSLALLLVAGRSANAQEADTSTGSVVSASRNTLMIRTTDGQYQLFVSGSRDEETSNNPGWPPC